VLLKINRSSLYHRLDRPSSKICSIALKTSWCAFSISSNRAPRYMVYALPLLLTVRPPRNPRSREARLPGARQYAFSIYSDISSRIILRSSSKSASASVRASSVLPTPVGPRKMKLPTGRFGSLIPLRALKTASATAFTASSCPITRSCKISSSRTSFSRSPSRRPANRHSCPAAYNLGDFRFAYFFV
jgi:hypothetical protein